MELRSWNSGFGIPELTPFSPSSIVLRYESSTISGDVTTLKISIPKSLPATNVECLQMRFFAFAGVHQFFLRTIFGFFAIVTGWPYINWSCFSSFAS